jgi:hypothetical protein
MKASSRLFYSTLGSGLVVLFALAAWHAPAAERDSSVPVDSSMGDLHLAGPFTCENLTIFLVRGEDQIKNPKLLTLQEALDRHEAVVHETGNVNQLTIENRSREADVFVQAGDIVKGGQQDRIMAIDLILPPAKSGKPVATPVAAYCVEPGRWQQRGNEESTRFEASLAQAPSKDLKVAAREGLARAATAAPMDPVLMRTVSPYGGAGSGAGRNAASVGLPDAQQDVWRGVTALQKKLRKNLNTEVQQAASLSSLQLTLETPAVREATKKYLDALSAIVQKYPDVVGFVFAINGRPNSAEIYGCRALFLKLWPKLLQSSAIEAVAEASKSKPAAPLTADSVKKWLADASKGKSVSRDFTPRVRLVILDRAQTILVETRDRDRQDAWIHRSYLTK